VKSVRRLAVVAIAIISLVLGWLGVATAQSSAPQASYTSASSMDQDRMRAAPVEESYYLGDWRFGPAELPTSGPVSGQLVGYDRFGGMTPQQLLDTYWDDERGSWRYPDQDGYVIGTDGEPIKGAVTLEPGQVIDRFGGESGRFLSPAGVSYANRALPPSNLNTRDSQYPNNYHLYEVISSFTVDAGPISPWFAQPGGGLQYVLNPDHLPAAGTELDVSWLVEQGFLKRLN
jgi:hypothetical protein